MPKLNIFAPFNMAITVFTLNNDFDILPNNEPNAEVITMDFDDADNSALTLSGTFTVDSVEETLSGTVTAANFVTEGETLFQISGLSVDINDIIQGEFTNGEAIFAALFGGKTKMVGTAEADSLFGYGGKDTIKGKGGNDLLEGNDGKDKLYGGSGDDEIYGNDGNDKIFGDAGHDFLDGGEGNDKINGGDGEDNIFGRSGNDKLNGNAGDDFIRGEAGADKMTGGDGADTFLFATGDIAGAGKSTRDTITDLAADDILDFRSFTGAETSGDLFDALTFSDDGFIEGTNGVIIFEGGKLQIDADGDLSTDFAVKLSGVTELLDGQLLI